MPILEICSNSYHSALAAEKGGAHRIELCQNLEAGGITPSYGLIRKVKQTLRIPVHVLIRPRPGGFVYDDDEFDIMLDDARMCRDLSCDGVVVGFLTPDTRVDVPRLMRFVQEVKPVPVTFHRAVDDCADQKQALEDIIEAGCERVLTSGGCESALEGRNGLAELVTLAKGRVVIMPGAGITAHNLGVLVEATGAMEYHASAKAVLERSALKSRFDVAQLQTDADQVEALVRVLADVNSAVT